MAIYVTADLHLSFNNPKPMDIFGKNWENHYDKIKTDWLKKVKPEDTILLLGDFSWEMNLKDTLKDFNFLNSLPGKKIMLKGNHDYWWTTVTSIKNFLNENNIHNIDFLYNNCFEIEDKFICGTRGWQFNYNESKEFNEKITARECIRLKLSLDEAKKQNLNNKEIIACFHYPPITKIGISRNENLPFIDILKQYGVKKCYYGHLHGEGIKDAVEGDFDEIQFKLVSLDGADFKLTKI